MGSHRVPTSRLPRPLVASALVATLAIALWPCALSAQRGRGRFGRSIEGAPDSAFAEFNIPYDGRVTFVRMRFTPDRTGWGGGGGFFGGVNYWWDHDYPRAEHHFSTMLHELTSIEVSVDGSEILAPLDSILCKFPIAYVSEPGHWRQTDAEAAALRAYLLKGGFLIFDDFSDRFSRWEWMNFQEQMQRVLPGYHFVRLDGSHPIFHSFFDIDSLETFRHPYYGMPVQFYGVFQDDDPGKRLLAIINYDNDVGESWEWSDTGVIPIDITNEAYKLGINYIVYALTH